MLLGMVKIQYDIPYSNVLASRPNLPSIIPNLIYGIESQSGLSEKYSLRSRDEIKELVTEHTLRLDSDSTVRSAEKVTKLCEFGLNLGFSFRESINEIHHALSDTHHKNGRTGSNVAAEEQRSSRFDAEQEHWATMKKHVMERDFNALLKPSFDPCIENKEQEHVVKNLNAKILLTWGVFYCGGGQAVISDLRGVSIDYNIDLHVDAYAW